MQILLAHGNLVGTVLDASDEITQIRKESRSSISNHPPPKYRDGSGERASEGKGTRSTGRQGSIRAPETRERATNHTLGRDGYSRMTTKPPRKPGNALTKPIKSVDESGNCSHTKRARLSCPETNFGAANARAFARHHSPATKALENQLDTKSMLSTFERSRHGVRRKLPVKTRPPGKPRLPPAAVTELPVPNPLPLSERHSLCQTRTEEKRRCYVCVVSVEKIRIGPVWNPKTCLCECCLTPS